MESVLEDDIKWEQSIYLRKKKYNEKFGGKICIKKESRFSQWNKLLMVIVTMKQIEK